MDALTRWTAHRLSCHACQHVNVRTACREGLPLYLGMLDEVTVMAQTP